MQTVLPALFPALTLAERLAAPPSRDVPVSPEAVVRLERWKRQAPFNEPGWFERRLAEAGIDEAGLLALLAETPEMLARRLPPPAWLCAVATCLQDFAGISPRLAELVAGLPDSHARACTRLAAPLLQPAVAQLEAGLRSLAEAAGHVPFQPDDLTRMLLAHVADLLGLPMMRTLAVEVNVARLNHELAGQTGAERFDNFVDRAAAPSGARALLARYPVLARHLHTLIQSWQRFSLRFLGHLLEDWPRLRADLLAGGPGPPRLVAIEAGQGDRHRDGQSVLQLSFSDGRRLVYKPHSLAIDRHVQELLARLNQAGPAFDPGWLELRTLGVLDCGDHGYCEFVESRPCRGRGELARFYRRQGALLAVLYATEATDIHSENVIASGEHPVLVDLEALFHAGIGFDRLDDLADPAIEATRRSVLKSLLLPQRIDSTSDTPGYDISGLGDRPGQVLPRPVPIMTALGTDEMSVTYRRLDLEPGPSVPTLDGTAVDVLDFVEPVCAGFEAGYRVILGLRQELLDDLARRFADVPVRVIARDTAVYDQMLRTSFHPAFLGDGLERERIFDRLWLAARYQRALVRLIPCERADLHAGDIPVFAAPAGSRDVLDSRGHVLPGLLEQSGLEAALQRIRSLDDADLARQLWLIRASFATIPIGKGQIHWKHSHLEEHAPPCDRDRLVQLARNVGERVCDLALTRGGRAGWLGVSLEGEREWQVVPAGPDLYNGAAGIALFLAHLHAVTGLSRFAEVAAAALANVRADLATPGALSGLPSIGAFTGLTSAVYLLAHLSVLWQDERLADEAGHLLEPIGRHVGHDREFDVLDGAAGCILGLLALHRVRPSPRVLELARACGEHLLGQARTQTRGIAWPSSIEAEAPLTGFSHGASGIGLSLLLLSRALDEPRFLAAGLAAFEYERGVFSHEQQNWPDHRRAGGEGPGYMATWCHGAPGIGLARLAALAVVDDHEIEQELAIAVETTMRSGFGLNHCLCHGDLGNLELLFLAARRSAAPAARAAFERRLGAVADSVQRQGCLTGIPLGVETPGLMAGISGIGYQLLRFSTPDVVPSVLLLQAPPIGGEQVAEGVKTTAAGEHSPGGSYRKAEEAATSSLRSPRAL